MTKRKPRSRKAPAARASRRGVGPLWWGVGVLALGWIAFDANRSVVERHVPQLARLHLPFTGPASEPPRREAAAPRPALPKAPRLERAAEPQRVAVPVPVAVPETVSSIRPARPEARPALGAAPPTPPAPRPTVAAPPAAAAPAAAAPPRAAAIDAGRGFVTRGPTPLRRAPRAGAPVWMVLDAGRPLRVTRREGGFARVESGIFTGWVEASIVPEPAARPAPPRAGTMPTLAAADTRRGGPVPMASVPKAGVPTR